MQHPSRMIALVILVLVASCVMGLVALANGETRVYLPTVQGGSAAATDVPTATPTTTPTPTPTSPPPLVSIPNGDFEAGPGAGWHEQSPQGGIIVQGEPPTLPALRAGGWYAHLGGYHNLGETVNWQSRLTQSEFMVLPAAPALALHLHYQILSEEQPNEFNVCDRDVLNIWVNTPSNSILWEQAQICEGFNTNGWTPFVLDLSHFAGQSIALEFQMRTDFENVSHVLLDDLTLRAVP